MFVDSQFDSPPRIAVEADEQAQHQQRLELLMQRLPPPLPNAVRWLRRPTARWVRIPVGLLLVLGGIFSILPILGLWMLPLGVVLLAQDVKLLQRLTDRILVWIERHRPHWIGLPKPPRY